MSLPTGIHKNETTDAHGYTLRKTDQTRRTPRAELTRRHPRKCLTKTRSIANVFLNDFFFSESFIRVNPCPSVVSLLTVFQNKPCCWRGGSRAKNFYGRAGAKRPRR